MGMDESDDLVACAACGSVISRSEDRAYAFGTDSAICLACGLRRGGAYDEEEDRWRVAPQIDDLLRSSEAREDW
jgi:hypothetical protein